MPIESELPAGDFSDWLLMAGNSARAATEADVPCGTCVACCSSSQFVHVAPDEADALAHIPAELLFPAPGEPDGHLLLGYDELGRCPMLGDHGCTIYEHRPRTCRTYDCRIFAAAAVTPEAPRIAERVQCWRFTHDDSGQVRHDAVVATAVFLRNRENELPADHRPINDTHLALLAIEASPAFLEEGEDGSAPRLRQPEPGEVAATLQSRP